MDDEVLDGQWVFAKVVGDYLRRITYGDNGWVMELTLPTGNAAWCESVATAPGPAALWAGRRAAGRRCVPLARRGPDRQPRRRLRGAARRSGGRVARHGQGRAVAAGARVPGRPEPRAPRRPLRHPLDGLRRPHPLERLRRRRGSPRRHGVPPRRGRNGWPVLTADMSIRRRPHELAVVEVERVDLFALPRGRAPWSGAGGPFRREPEEHRLRLRPTTAAGRELGCLSLRS